MEKETVVCFGGGSMVPNLLLANLKSDFRVVGVTSMVDNGGSTGQLRHDFGVLPPGDIVRHMIALSDAPEWKKKFFAFRFGQEVFDGGHKGHRFANVFLAGLEWATGDFGKALEEAEKFLEIKNNRALPATTDKITVYAELEDGTIAKGEDEIDVPKEHDPNKEIVKISLDKSATAYPPVIEEIKKAKMITFGPGDFYSSVAPCLLPAGMAQAIRESKAKKILICNTVQKLGETQGFTVEKFAAEIEKYIGGPLDYVIYQTPEVSEEMLAQIQKESPEIIGAVGPVGQLDANKFIGKDLLAEGKFAYDPQKVKDVILELAKK